MDYWPSSDKDQFNGSFGDPSSINIRSLVKD